MVRGNRSEKCGRSLWTEQACWYPSFRIVSSENTLCLLAMSDSRRFKRALCFVCIVRRSKGGWTAFRMGVGYSWKERFSPLLNDVHRFFQATGALALV